MSKRVPAVILLTWGFVISALQGSQNLDRARQLERTGDTSGARTLLARAAQNNPGDITSLTEYAEFLDIYGDPGARDAYSKVLAAVQKSGDSTRAAATARRLLELDLMSGDRAAAAEHAAAYRTASGRTVALALTAEPPKPEKREYIAIPGPLRSFGRMAAISTDVQPEDVLPALARNVVTNGYQASHSNDALEQTEYLKLVHRYISQARELERLAGDDKIISVENCDSAKAGELLRILGFRMRGGCGSEVVLETVNATRAFLTTDSGFPLADLEQALRTNRPFVYDFRPTQRARAVLGGILAPGQRQGQRVHRRVSGRSRHVPALSGAVEAGSGDRRGAAQGVTMTRLKAYAHVLDFFGGHVRDPQRQSRGSGRRRTTRQSGPNW